MKKLLASALALVGISPGAQAQPTLQTVDPKSISFTTPTLSNDIAELEPFSGQPSKEDLVLHEDEWAQVEFLRVEQLPAIKKALREGLRNLGAATTGADADGRRRYRP